MDTWETANGIQRAAPPPRPPLPTRSMSGDDTLRNPSRKPLVSFGRSTSLAATVSTPTRGLPIPPPLPPLPPEVLRRKPSLRPQSPQSIISPFSYSPPHQQPASFVPKPAAPLSPPLPPKPPTKYTLFDSGPVSPRAFRSPTRSNSPPPPVVPPRPVTAHGAQSSYPSSSSARDRLPPLPTRPNALSNSPISDSSDDSWSVVSPTVDNPWLSSPVSLAQPRSNRFNFLHIASKRPHTAVPSQSLPFHNLGPNFGFPTKPAGPPPLPPLPVSMPAPNGPVRLPVGAGFAHPFQNISRPEPENKVQQQEDEELAQAIAESLALSKKASSSNTTVNSVIGIQLTESFDDPSGAEANYTLYDETPTPGGLQIPSTDRSYMDLNSPFDKEAPTPTSLFLDMDDSTNFSPQSPEDELAIQLMHEETRQMATDILAREEMTRRDAELSRQLHEEEEARIELEKRTAELERQTQVEKVMNKLREAQEQRDAELARMMQDEWEQSGQPSSESAGSHPLPPLPSPSPHSPPSLPTLLPPPQSPPSLPTQPLQPLHLNTTQAGPAGIAFNDEAKPPLPSKSVHSLLTTSPPLGSGLDLSSIGSTTSPISTSRSEASVSRSHSNSSAVGPEAGSSHTTHSFNHNNNYNVSLQQHSKTWSRESSPGPKTVTASPGSHVLPESRNLNNKDGDTGDQIADLRGFSYGFTQPNIPVSPPQATLACAPLPDIINLSPTPYPSFHLMAPSWRHLLRLLAGQETRIQAHIDVLASVKEEQKLRVVIQFVKLAYTANTWRTIIHLSLDEPFPPTVPPSATTRFTNGDTTVLPYSYAISDHGRYMLGPNMHIYTVPLSPTSPFPILPITFPNLALYLQSAMKDSRARKVRHDSFRRLAKIVQSCYPEEMSTTQEEKKPSRGVGNLIKRVVGRGNSDRGDATGNEDVYDMITPFRLDQYTTTVTTTTSTTSSP